MKYRMGLSGSVLGFDFVISIVLMSFGFPSVSAVMVSCDVPSLARQRMLLIEAESLVEPFTGTPALKSPSDHSLVAASAGRAPGAGSVPGVATWILFASAAWRSTPFSPMGICSVSHTGSFPVSSIVNSMVFFAG